MSALTDARQMKRQEVIEELRRVARALGENSLARSEFRRHGGRFSTSTVAETFGSWNAAIKAAGLLPRAPGSNFPRKERPTRQEVIAELQRVAKSLGKDSLGKREFRRHGAGFSTAMAECTFGSWNAAVQAAGLTPVPKKARTLPDEVLANEFQRVRDLLGTVPTHDQFAAHSKHSPGPYIRRFGRWSAAVAHYTGAAVPERKKAKAARPSQPPVTGFEQVRAVTGSSQPKRAFGPLLNFRGMEHEPLNEQAVIILFGKIAEDLGFVVEAVRQGYPDCSAKRQVKRGPRVYYERVEIEFEFLSSNFRDHGHDPALCDLVVCWEHNWRECPVEVLELKSEIPRLRNQND